MERLRRPGRAGRKSRILDDWCRKVGRDPKEIERSVNFRSSEIRNAERYVENGFTHLLLAFSGPYHDLGPLRELIAWRDGHRERNPETAVS
ncbi:MAG: hypothetical protein M3358_07085 [Actinomycetota bacterium]|nr:hypothetical protein [Actinomycetota bacterium]